MPYRNLTTDDVKAKLESGQSFRLIDVREHDEYTIAHIEGSELLPLSQARDWMTTLPRDAEIIFF